MGDVGVTGATGFIGSAVVRKLLEQQRKVRAIIEPGANTRNLEGLPVVVVNPAFPFGPGDVAPTPTGAIVLALLRKQVPGVTTGGFCAIDVDDCATGHLLAEEKGRVGERYILGQDNVTLKQFFARV